MQLISQIVNARVAIVRLGDFLAADVQPELPLVPPAPPGEAPTVSAAAWVVLIICVSTCSEGWPLSKLAEPCPGCMEAGAQQ